MSILKFIYSSILTETKIDLHHPPTDFHSIIFSSYFVIFEWILMYWFLTWFNFGLMVDVVFLDASQFFRSFDTPGHCRSRYNLISCLFLVWPYDLFWLNSSHKFLWDSSIMIEKASIYTMNALNKSSELWHTSSNRKVRQGINSWSNYI